MEYKIIGIYKKILKAIIYYINMIIDRVNVTPLIKQNSYYDSMVIGTINIFVLDIITIILLF